MVRTPFRISAVMVLLLASAVGCTVQDTKAPALMGPSGLSVSLTLQADKPILERGGSTTVRIKAVNHQNQPMAMSMRAELLAQGSLFDYGRLSTRDITTNSDGTAVVTYFAPAPVSPPSDSGDDIVTVVVTPTLGGDSRGLQSRQLDIRLVPQGVIIPNLPLVPAFTVSPNPQTFAPVIFNASTTTWGGTTCMDRCGYVWTFGDGTSASGRIAEKTYPSIGSYSVYLRVTDPFGLFLDSPPQLVNVVQTTLLTPVLTFSPTDPGPGTTVFFDATATRGPSPIVEYHFTFGDGAEQKGVSPTATHVYVAEQNYVVRLTVRDSAGRVATVTVTVAVSP